MSLFPRPDYLKRLLKFRDKQLIKVITGVRRCGKSTLLELLREHLRSEGVEDSQMIVINFEDFDAQPLTEPAVLHAFIKERLLPDKMNYIFLDEIQQVQDFPKVVDSLYLKKNVDIYLTGSNASLLSTDIATLLTGRYVQLHLLPLSFNEFVAASDSKASLALQYRRFLETSSFPFALQLDDAEAVQAYLEGLYNTILFKDVMGRNQIADGAILESLATFMLDSIGSEVSPSRVANTLTSRRSKTNVKTVDKYMSALVDSQLFYEAKRYDIKGKKLLERISKFYAVDMGLRRAILGRSAANVGHILENVVYLDLLRRGFDVFVGKQGEFEVDFVARKPHETLYVQVAPTVRDEQTLERALRPLRIIKDNYPKIILTLDEDPVMDYDGILHTNALEWLVS